MVAVSAGGYALLAGVWTYWQKQDIKRFYRHRTLDKTTDPLGGREFFLFLLTLILLAVVAIAVDYTGEYATPWHWATTLNWYLALVAAAMIFIPIIVTGLSRKKLRKLETSLFEKFPRDAHPADETPEPAAGHALTA